MFVRVLGEHKLLTNIWNFKCEMFGKDKFLIILN